VAVRRPLYRAKWTRHTLLMTNAHAGGALGPALLGLGPIHPKPPDPLCTSLTVPTLDGVCRLDTPDGCAAFVARCVVAAATPPLARGEVARLHNR
jgi:hypothetical protein